MNEAWIAQARVVLTQLAAGSDVPRDEQRAAVKDSLAELVKRSPGRSVEVRIPPFAAVQVVEGATHRRGTPPAVVETDPQTWLALALGEISWEQAVASGRLRASGARSDISALIPLI